MNTMFFLVLCITLTTPLMFPVLMPAKAYAKAKK